MGALLERFLCYVKLDTQSNELSHTSPSTEKQLQLSRLLAEECRKLELQDVSCSENGIVMATIPKTVTHDVPMIVWNSHIDTSPECSGTDVKPVVHEKYNGEDIQLPGDPAKVIRIADNPTLKGLKGTTIITSDGTTLLGADDKSGIAVIMAAAEYLQAHPEISHGDIRICFTVDEEIGRGIVGLDLQKLGGICGYTLDSSGVGIIDVETFSADQAIVTIRGKNSHPSEAKSKGMINAVRLLSNFISRLPVDHLSPEYTDGREGFIHPYAIEGGVAESSVRIILRDFEKEKLEEYAFILQKLAKDIEGEHPGSSVEVLIKKQYRNMREGLHKEPRAVEYALEAMQKAGLYPKKEIIRGGTDGSLLTEKGLPCPNLSSGQHNPHSPLEWASLWEMEKAVEVLIQLASIWSKEMPILEIS